MKLKIYYDIYKGRSTNHAEKHVLVLIQITMSEAVTVTSPQSTTVVIGMAAVLITVAVAWWHQRVTGRNRVPTKWRRVGEISEMTIYPLKSGRGVELKEAFCTDLGLRTVIDQTTELLDRYVQRGVKYALSMLSNAECEADSTSGAKKREYLLDKSNDLETKKTRENVLETCAVINEFKKGCQPRNNLIKMRMGICLQIHVSL